MRIWVMAIIAMSTLHFWFLALASTLLFGK